jgi:transposase-like protein
MRDKKAAMRFFENATLANGIPEKVAMAKSVANRSAIDQSVEDKDITV